MTKIQVPTVARFIHQNDEGAPRFTAAYIRTTDAVYFAWATLYHTDIYVKSIGREISFDRLSKFTETLLPPETFINEYMNVGIIDIEDVQEKLSAIIADHVNADLTFMDLKHAFISDLVRGFILDTL